jgi:hypothetical protein
MRAMGLHDFFTVAGVTEVAQGGGKSGDPQAKLVDSLSVLEGDRVKLRLESPHAHVQHVVISFDVAA